MNSKPSNKEPHIPVMIDEVLKGFEGIKIEVFYDGTLGSGGHASEILKAHPEIKQYIACDKDPDALEIARERLAHWEKKMVFIQGNFADLDLQLQERGITQVEGFFLI